MKKGIKKLLVVSAVLITIAIAAVISLNNFIMPWYVEAKQVELPNLVGMHKDQAIKTLESLNLKPVEEGPRFDARFEVDHVLFQNPSAGRKVKENRRVYIHISGGEPLVKMPNLRQKTFRDARITLDRLGLAIRDLEQIKSELPADIIVDQEFEEGTWLAKGDSIDLKISIGPRIGMIAVPNIIARSESDAIRILRRNNLFIGQRTYVESTLLTNTIISQSPSEGYLLNIGDSVDVEIAISRR
jgi:beta-lactam-binding protein with PASTA domain